MTDFIMAADPPHVSDKRYMISDQATSRNPRYFTPNQPQPTNTSSTSVTQPLSRVSRFSDMDELLTESANLRNIVSTYLASKQSSVHRLTTSQVSQSREASYILSDQARCRETRYTTDQDEENYFASNLSHTLQTDSRSPDPTELHEMKFVVSSQLSLQEMRNRASNWAVFRDSKSVTPNQGQSENARFTSSDQPTSFDSPFKVLDQPLTEIAILHKAASTLLASKQNREHEFGTSQLSELQEANCSILDIAQRRGPRYTLDQPQENKYSISNHWQPLETGYTAPDPPHISETRFTVPDHVSPHEIRYMASDQSLSHDSRYMTPKQNQSDNSTISGSDQPQSQDSIFRVLDEPLAKPTILQNVESTFLASELSHFHEASYTVLDPAQRRVPRHTSEQSQGNEYWTGHSPTS